MEDFASRFGFDKMHSGNAAVYKLKEQLEGFPAAHAKVDACEEIARCFFQLEQYHDAASWYEAAGKMILAEPSSKPTLKALSALEEYERALECYELGDDDDGFTECSALLRQLERACASA